MRLGLIQVGSHFFSSTIHMLPGDCVFLHMLLHQICSKFLHIHLSPLLLLLHQLVKHGLACYTDYLYKIVLYISNRIDEFSSCVHVAFHLVPFVRFSLILS